MYIGLGDAPAFRLLAPNGREDWEKAASTGLDTENIPKIRGCVAIAMRFGIGTQDSPIDRMAAQVIELLEKRSVFRRSDVTDVGARWDRLVDPKSASVQIKAARIPEERPGGPGKIANSARGVAT